jgi:phosphoribosylaminoimidazole (AIR) synthetase
VFHQLVEWSSMSRAEALRVFNMGVGMVVIAAADQAATALETVPESFALGQLVERTGGAPVVHVFEQ